jgi:hypothetical protein
VGVPDSVTCGHRRQIPYHGESEFEEPMIPTNKTELESRLPPIPDPRQSPNARNYEEGEEKEEETKRSQEFSGPNGQVVAWRLILILSAQHRSFCLPDVLCIILTKVPQRHFINSVHYFRRCQLTIS